MGYGDYDNELELYWPAVCLGRGLWVEDPDRSLWIIPNSKYGLAEIEGTWEIVLSDGRNVLDELNRDCRESQTPDGFPTQAQIQSLGLAVIPDFLKRFNPWDGYYHA